MTRKFYFRLSKFHYQQRKEMVVHFYCADNAGVYANAGFAIAVFANVVFAIAGVLYNFVVNYISLVTVNPSNPRSER